MARRSPSSRIPRMERFVGVIVAGGISLVTGLWVVSLFELGTPQWILGAFLVVGGSLGLAYGIWSEIEL